MDRFTRRDAFRMGAGAALGTAALAGEASAQAGIPTMPATAPSLPLEAGATIRVIRPTKFVDADEVVWNENQAKFIKAALQYFNLRCVRL